MAADENQPEKSGDPQEDQSDGASLDISTGGFTLDTEGNLIEVPAGDEGIVTLTLDEEAPSSSPAPATADRVTAEFDRTLASGQITSGDLDHALSQLDSGSVILEDDPDQETTRSSGPVDTRVETQEGGQIQVEGTLDERILKKMDEADSRESLDPLIGLVLGGRFEVLEKIGEGGMGAVYKARQKGIERDVAIKVLLGDMAKNPTLVRRFHLEALAISKLKHPNTIQIFDFGETDDGLLYIVMELL